MTIHDISFLRESGIDRAAFEHKMALALAPVFAEHFLAQNDVYVRNFAVRNTGCTQDDIIKFQTGDLAKMTLENIRNFTVFLSAEFGNYYFPKSDAPKEP